MCVIDVLRAALQEPNARARLRKAPRKHWHAAAELRAHGGAASHRYAHRAHAPLRALAFAGSNASRCIAAPLARVAGCAGRGFNRLPQSCAGLPPMAHYQAHHRPGHGTPGPGQAAPGSGHAAPSLAHWPSLAPTASPRPTATPSRTPSRFGRSGGVFRYKYYSRDELEDASRRQGSRADGMDPALEKRRRKNYVAWMKDLTKELRLPHLVLSTAIIYMHRYFALKVRLGNLKPRYTILRYRHHLHAPLLRP